MYADGGRARPREIVNIYYSVARKPATLLRAAEGYLPFMPSGRPSGPVAAGHFGSDGKSFERFSALSGRWIDWPSSGVLSRLSSRDLTLRINNESSPSYVQFAVLPSARSTVSEGLDDGETFQLTLWHSAPEAEWSGSDFAANHPDRSRFLPRQMADIWEFEKVRFEYIRGIECWVDRGLRVRLGTSGNSIRVDMNIVSVGDKIRFNGQERTVTGTQPAFFGDGSLAHVTLGFDGQAAVSATSAGDVVEIFGPTTGLDCTRQVEPVSSP